MTHSKSKIQNPKSSLPRYPRYKDSGIEWIGEVPEHWEVRRNLGVFDERKECNQPEEELLSVTVSRGIIRQSEITAKKDSSNDDKSKYKVVRVGDLAYNKMRAWQGALGISAFNGIVSPAYVVLTPRNQKLSKYFHYLYRTPQFITEANRLSYGLCDDMNSLRYEHFKTSYSPLPPDNEIDRIVAFLDQKTAEIDVLIAKKQRQIELLDEQKAILINRAVTRGLNPNAKLKPSGIEWIGDIPEHWITAPMYSRCDVRLGKMLDAAKIKGKHLQPYLRNTDVQWFEINSLDLPLMDFRQEEYERYSVKRGDLVVCEGGEPGRAALWDSDDPCFFQKALHRVRPMKGDDPRFLLYLFRNAVTMAAFSGVDKATIAHLTGEQLRRFRFVFPPVMEQAGIAAYLTDAQIQFSEATQKIESHIDSLKNLRSTLIAHAVTGRIKV